jgi:class 3 adenylate cyclase/tetratricopeptide (TPR) repeat protein
MSTSVLDWLKGLGLEQYAQAFRDNDIDSEVLPELTGDDLVALGVTSIGHRRKLLAAISALAGNSTAGAARRSSSPEGVSVSQEPADVAGAERRLLTIMFCDLVASTELATRLDPEDLREIISKYHRCVAQVLAGLGGFVAKYMGDGILAYFGYPHAHEEDAEQAVRAGLTIVDAVGRLDLPQRLQVRIGIATGLAVVGDLIGEGSAQEQAVVGETPNLAARMQALAGPNGVVIADTTRRHIGGLFELRDLGPQQLKGFASTLNAWEVLSESGVASRFEALRSPSTALVGRGEEIELLLRRWDQAKSGEGRVVLISAEPGIGKSRLTEALEERIAHEPHRRLRYFCSPHHQDSAFYPVIGHLERAAGFAREDDNAARRRKLAAMAAASGVTDDDRSLLVDLLSVAGEDAQPNAELTPQRRKEKTFDLLIGVLEAIARHQPVLMVFEDLHWIDPTSRELLDRMIARVEQLPLLLIATFRPEFQPPWIGQSHVTMMTLSRLGRREGATLVRHLVGESIRVPADVLDEIVERTDGVPLFLEEVTKVVLESLEAPGADGARIAVSSIPGHRTAVPATLQASLLARLDRLGPRARDVAQAGAAIGREFTYDIIAAVSPGSEADTRAALDQLVAAGLMFQRGNPPAADYQFKHALVQDTAYGTLLRGPRQALHGRIAAAIETRTPDRTEREPEILAHHLAEAGQFQRAVSFLFEAGRRAAARSGNLEAVAHLNRAVEMLTTLPENPERLRLELEAQLALGPAVMATRGFRAPQAETAYRRARELAENLSDSRSLFAALWGIWISTGQSNDKARNQRLVDELFRVARPLNDNGLALQAHHCAWATLVIAGDLASANEHVRQGLELYDRQTHGKHALLYGGHDPAVCGMGQGGVALWMLGYPDQAVDRVRQGIALAHELKHPPSVGHALWFAGIVRMMCGDAVAVGDLAERLLRLSSEHSLAQYRAVGGSMRGWARAKSKELDAGLDEFRISVASYMAAEAPFLAFFMLALADTELRAGHLVEAERALQEGQKVLKLEPIWTSEILRLSGDLQMARNAGDWSAAEQLYDEALSVARSHNARSFELRAALGLARLRHRQGRVAEAQDLLRPVCSWFTEGFKSADLQAAQALLG